MPDAMFNDPERSRLTMLRGWVLDKDVTEIEMNERQFWNFAHLQPVAEKPWATFMAASSLFPTCLLRRRSVWEFSITIIPVPYEAAGLHGARA